MDRKPTYEELEKRVKQLEEAESKLRKTEADYNRFMDMSHNLVCIVRIDSGYFTYTNSAWNMVLGYSSEELKGYPYHYFLHPEDRDASAAEVEKLAKNHLTFDFENRYCHKDGSLRTILWTAVPIVCEGLIYCVGQDITERMKAIENLKMQQALSNNILESISDGFFALDDQLVVKYFNTAAENILGRKREEILGKNLFEAFPEAKGSIFEEKYLLSAKERKTISFETYFETSPYRDWYDVRVYPFDNGISVYFKVITEQKQAEDELRKYKDQLEILVKQRTAQLSQLNGQLQKEVNDREQVEKELIIKDMAISSSASAISMADLEGNIFYSNKSFLDIFGFEEETEIQGMPISKLMTNEEDLHILMKELTENGISTGETIGLKKDGTKINLHHMASVVIDNDGKPICFIGSLRDITDQKRIERDLLEANKLLEGIIEQSPIPMAVALPDGEAKIFNQAVIEQLGIEEDFGIKPGINLFELKPTWRDYGTDGKFVPIEKIPLALALQGKICKNLEWRVVRSDGTERWQIVTATPIYDNDGNLIAGFVSFPDITELKLAMEAMHIERDLGIGLSSTMNMEDALAIVMKNLTKVKGIDSAGVYLVDTNTGELNLTAHRGLSPEFVENISHYKKDSMQAKLVMEGKRIYQMYSEFGSIKNNVLQSENLRAFGVIPIHHRDLIIGCLNVASRSLDNIPESSRNAVETISTQIGGVIARIKAEEKLFESQERLQSFFDSIDEFLFILDSDGRISQTNPAAVKRLGYPEKELINMPVLDLHPPDQREKVKGLIADTLAGRASSYSIPLQTKAGDLVMVETRVSKGKWGGEDILFMISRDITERRRADEALKKYADTQAVLLREVNHRVKNNLSAIIGMLLKERELAKVTEKSDYREALGDLIRRIEGLSTVHSMLSAGGWRPLLLTELCEQVIHAALQGLPINKKILVDVETSLIKVSSNQAHHLTLVINELTTNTVKHALGNREAGRISVNVFQDDGKARIVFKDDGPGYPDEIIEGDFISASIGFDLIFGIVKESLRGNAFLENDNGASTTILFELETSDQIWEA